MFLNNSRTGSETVLIALNETKVVEMNKSISGTCSGTVSELFLELVLVQFKNWFQNSSGSFVPEMCLIQRNGTVL